jgi:hypothetical protein
MIQRRIVVLLLSILLAIPIVVGGAQTPNPEAEMREDTPGIQAWVLRTYGHPDAEVGRALTPEAMATLTLRTIDIMVKSFETEAQAVDHFEAESTLPFDLGPDAESFDGELASGYGTWNFFRQRVDHNTTGTMVIEQLTVQQDEIVFTVNLSFRASYRDGMEAPAEVNVPDVIAPLGRQIANQVSNGVEVNEGNAADGLWNLLPSAGDPLLLGLVPWIDQQTYPPLTMEATPAAMPGEMTTPLDPTTLPGLETIGTRIYQSGGPGIGTAAYAAQAAAYGPTVRQDLALNVTIYQFNSVTDAVSAFSPISDNGPFGAMGISQLTGTATTAQVDLPDPGDQARSDQVTITTTGANWARETTLEQLTVLDGDMVIVLESVSTRGSTASSGELDDSRSPVVDLAAAMVTTTPEADTNPVFAADGTSTGGIWDVMPATDDSNVMGLVPTIDLTIFPPADD